jgi:hypothetical protein
MTTLRSHKKLRLILIPLAFSAVAASGCTAWDVHELPAMPFVSKPPKEYRPVGVSLNLQASDPAEIYHSVNQARAENGVVLQIVGDDKSPIRVLPLPPVGYEYATFALPPVVLAAADRAFMRVRISVE